MQTVRTVILRKSTQPTRLLRSQPSEQVLFFVRRFIENATRVYTVLSLVEKLIQQRTDFSRSEKQLVQDYLQMELRITQEGVFLSDRCGKTPDIVELLQLRDKILELMEAQSLHWLQSASKTPFVRTLKQVLARTRYDNLSEEAQATLREAYLSVRHGRIVTARGRWLGAPSWTQRWMWKLIS